MKKKLAVLILLVTLAVTGALAQVPFFGGLPVIDASNLVNAIKRLPYLAAIDRFNS